MFNVIAFGERLKFLRETRNWSQREASFEMNWTAASWRDLEAGQKKVKVEDAVLIAAKYQVPIEWLILGHADKVSAEFKCVIEKRLGEMKKRLANIDSA